MGENEAETVKTLTVYRKIMGELIQQHRGRVIDSPGDNILAEFGSVVDAVQCSVAAQNEFKARNAELPENRRMEFRIGINLGDVIEEENRIYGDGVNIAARLEALADPGGICISKTAFDQIESKLPLGYQFLGEQTVKNIAKPVGAYKVLMEPRVTGAGRKGKAQVLPVWRRKSVFAGAVAVVIVIISVVVWNFYFRPPPIEPASKDKMAFPLPDKPSIAVLPFVNMSGDPAQEFIADGICESIITALGKIPEMFVIARTSTSTYKGKPVKIKQVGEELGVRYVLEGSVQKTDDRIRVTAQLIDAITGHHLWADRYDRDTKGFFDMLDEISKKVAIELQVKLTEGDAARMSQKTKNFEAWGYATTAYSLFRYPTKENTAKIRELCERAVKLDPEYAFAYGALGAAHWTDGFLGYTESRNKSLALAEECIDKSLRLDGTLPCATSVKARLYMMNGQLEQAIAWGEKAIALGPSQDLPYFYQGVFVGYAGRFEEAIALIKKSMRLNPSYPPYYLMNLANNYFLTGQYKQALEAHKKALEHYPKGGAPFVNHLGLSAVYMELGREEEARNQAAEVIKINPKVSLENLRKGYYSYYKDPTYSERFLSALRKAGIPEKPPLPLPDKPSIAVLPFVNMSDDKNQEFFSDGLTEEIITALSKTPKLFVIARNSSFVYKGKPVNVQQVSRELGVKYVLEGSVRRSGDQLRITAQLIDATTGNHLWAERYDREMKDIFEIQDEITMKILASFLQLTEAQMWQGRHPSNLQAYLKLLEGIGYWNVSKFSDAMKAFEEALNLDPDFPPTYGWIAWTHMMNVWFGPSATRGQSLEKAIEFAEKAKVLDYKAVAGSATLGHAYLLKRDYDKALSEGKLATELAPNSSMAATYLGWTLRSIGRYEEAMKEYERAVRLDPLNSYTLGHIATTYFMMRRYEESISACNKALELHPKQFSAHVTLAMAYSSSDKMDQAREAASNVLRINPNFSVEHFAKALPYKHEEDRVFMIDALRKAGLK